MISIKFSTSWLNSTGFSMLRRCPAPLMTFFVAFGIFARKISTIAWISATSRSPTRMRVGTWMASSFWMPHEAEIRSGIFRTQTCAFSKPNCLTRSRIAGFCMAGSMSGLWSHNSMAWSGPPSAIARSLHTLLRPPKTIETHINRVQKGLKNLYGQDTR